MGYKKRKLRVQEYFEQYLEVQDKKDLDSRYIRACLVNLIEEAILGNSLHRTGSLPVFKSKQELIEKTEDWLEKHQN